MERLKIQIFQINTFATHMDAIGMKEITSVVVEKRK
jgi:hypothetical protein